MRSRERVTVYASKLWGGWYWECECTHCPAPTYAQHGYWEAWADAYAEGREHALTHHPRKHVPHDMAA